MPSRAGGGPKRSDAERRIARGQCEVGGSGVHNARCAGIDRAAQGVQDASRPQFCQAPGAWPAGSRRSPDGAGQRSPQPDVVETVSQIVSRRAQARRLRASVRRSARTRIAVSIVRTRRSPETVAVGTGAGAVAAHAAMDGPISSANAVGRSVGACRCPNPGRDGAEKAAACTTGLRAVPVMFDGEAAACTLATGSLSATYSATPVRSTAVDRSAKRATHNTVAAQVARRQPAAYVRSSLTCCVHAAAFTVEAGAIVALSYPSALATATAIGVGRGRRLGAQNTPNARSCRPRPAAMAAWCASAG